LILSAAISRQWLFRQSRLEEKRIYQKPQNKYDENENEGENQFFIFFEKHFMVHELKILSTNLQIGFLGLCHLFGFVDS